MHNVETFLLQRCRRTPSNGAQRARTTKSSSITWAAPFRHYSNPTKAALQKLISSTCFGSRTTPHHHVRPPCSKPVPVGRGTSSWFFSYGRESATAILLTSWFFAISSRRRCTFFPEIFPSFFRSRLRHGTVCRADEDYDNVDDAASTLCGCNPF